MLCRTVLTRVRFEQERLCISSSWRAGRLSRLQPHRAWHPRSKPAADSQAHTCANLYAARARGFWSPHEHSPFV